MHLPATHSIPRDHATHTASCLPCLPGPAATAARSGSTNCDALDCATAAHYSFQIQTKAMKGLGGKRHEGGEKKRVQSCHTYGKIKSLEGGQKKKLLIYRFPFTCVGTLNAKIEGKLSGVL
jgi:hypothetical protein